MTVGFYFNQDLCVGCKLCVVACKDRHGLDTQASYRTVESYSVGCYPDARTFHMSMSCNHCEHPACVENCPSGAMRVAEDGSVQHDASRCIGCKMCVNSCPWNAPDFREDLRVVGKCDSCKPLRELGEAPMCVAACPMRAIEFGEWGEIARLHPEATVWGGVTGPHYEANLKPYFTEDGLHQFDY